MSNQKITVCQICWKMTSHKTTPTLTPLEKVKTDKNNKQICPVCLQAWSPVQLVKCNGKWVYIRPRPANVPGEFKMCDKKGKCMRGASCTFAHIREELESWNKEREGPPMPDKPRPPPSIPGNRYMMCTHHANGFTGKRCLYGAECKFAHSQTELDMWNSTIANRPPLPPSIETMISPRTLSTSSTMAEPVVVPETKIITSPISSVDKRIIPGLPVTKTTSRTRLSSLSSNASITSDGDKSWSGVKALPVSLASLSSKVGTEVYRCEICDCTCTSKKQLQEHQAGAKHKQIARSSNAPEEPVIRSRPNLASKGIKEYEICGSVEESQRCTFGNGCPDAHSYEELEAWNCELNSSIQSMLPSSSLNISFLDKVRRELDSTDMTIDQLLQSKNGVMVEEISGVAQRVDHSGEGPLNWTFRLSSRHNQQLLGMIMLGEQYPQYRFISALFVSNGKSTPLMPTPSLFAIETKQMVYPGDIIDVQVEFSHQIGCFPQVVVFKFNGFFIGTLLQVTCMSSDSFALQTKHNQTVVPAPISSTLANWESVLSVVPLRLAEEKERDHCTEEYLPPKDSARIVLQPHLTMANYKLQMHNLLYVEECDRRDQLTTSQLPNMSCEVSQGYKDDYMYHCAPQGHAYLTFLIEEMSGNILRLIGRNKICEVKPPSGSIAYQGVLELFCREKIVICVTEQCAALCKDNTASVRFTQKRKSFKYMHHAIDRIGLPIIFPDYSPPGRGPKPDGLEAILDKSELNGLQRGVIEDILDPWSSHIPTLVCGPFGTGKTLTLVEAVAVLLQVNVMAKILVCTHSNSAADIYIERLDKKLGHEYLKGKVLRHYYYNRKTDSIKPTCLKYTNRVGNQFELPPHSQLKALSVIVTTITQSGDLTFCGMEPGHFTHIFIDEAAQVMEAEVLIPLQLSITGPRKSTKVVLAGDHMQMEAELVSTRAKEFGLQRSLLERLFQCPLYASAEGQQCRYQLINNYRTHPVILELPSTLFYDGNLIPAAVNRGPIVPTEPLSFYGMQGQENQDPCSFSFDNFLEATEVVKRVKHLRDLGLEDADICVLTPYSKQLHIIRYLLRRDNFGKICVENVYGIQGREYRALIVSTVRTCRAESEIKEEEIGFLSNPKLFNMAITRAKDWLVIVGEPYTLCTVGPNRTCWEKLVRFCISLGSFHFPNAQEFINVLSRPLVSKFPTLNERAIPPAETNRQEPLSDYTEHERKQFFKVKLLPLVRQICPQHSQKITTVLIEMNTQKMIDLFASDSNELQHKVKSTLEFLGIEESSTPTIPKYLTRQADSLTEHEQVIHSYLTRLLSHPNPNTSARILHEQLNLIKDQKMRLHQQYQLLLKFNTSIAVSAAPPRPVHNGIAGLRDVVSPLHNPTVLHNGNIGTPIGAGNIGTPIGANIGPPTGGIIGGAPIGPAPQYNNNIAPPGWSYHNSAFTHPTALTIGNSNGPIGAPLYNNPDTAFESAADEPFVSSYSGTPTRSLGPIGERHF